MTELTAIAAHLCSASSVSTVQQCSLSLRLSA